MTKVGADFLVAIWSTLTHAVNLALSLTTSDLRSFMGSFPVSFGSNEIRLMQ